MAKKLTNLRIDEVSSVDRGAGEGVKIMLMKRDEEPYWKREFSREERDRDAKSGAAESDGSFPIHNKSDLHNAMRAVGRSKNPSKTKAHIRARARALGLTSELSDAFKRLTMNKFTEMFAKVFGGEVNNNDETIDKALEGLTESVSSILGAENVDKASALSTTFEQFGDHLKETLTAGPAVTEKGDSIMELKSLGKALGLAETATEAEVAKSITDTLAAAKAATEQVAKLQSELKLAKAEFTESEASFYDKAFPPGDDDEDDADGKKKSKKAFRLASHTERSSVMKAAEPALPAHIQKMIDDNAAMAKRLAELEGQTNLVSLNKRAIEVGLPESEGATIAKALKGEQEAIDKLLGFVKSATATAKAAGVFKEFGTSHGNGAPSNATEELNVLAKNLQKADPKLSFAQAFAKVYENPDNVEIARRERGENRPSAA